MNRGQDNPYDYAIKALAPHRRAKYLGLDGLDYRITTCWATLSDRLEVRLFVRHEGDTFCSMHHVESAAIQRCANDLSSLMILLRDALYVLCSEVLVARYLLPWLLTPAPRRERIADTFDDWRDDFCDPWAEP